MVKISESTHLGVLFDVIVMQALIYMGYEPRLDLFEAVASTAPSISLITN